MADNVDVTPGSGATIATDQVGTAHYQLIKLAFGALDTATLVTSSAGLPVSVTNASLAVTAAALPLPTGAATEATFSALNGKVTACNTGAVTIATAIPAGTNNIGDVDVLSLPALPAGTNAIGKLAANDGVDIGDVTINNPSIAVTGTFWQATQPVSGTVAATQSGTWNIGTVATVTNVVHVDDNGSSLTVDGAVAATQSGTWNVGTVTTVAAVTAITNALPAGTNLIGKVSSGLDTSAINNGATALTPKFAAISASASGNSTAVAAVVGKKIRVLSYRFQAGADVDVKFRDNTAGVDLTGAMSTGTKGGGGGSAFSPVGHFETAAGNALSINLSGAVQVSGHLTYIEV
jgi:hypothetical protein